MLCHICPKGGFFYCFGYLAVEHVCYPIRPDRDMAILKQWRNEWELESHVKKKKKNVRTAPNDDQYNSMKKKRQDKHKKNRKTLQVYYICIFCCNNERHQHTPQDIAKCALLHYDQGKRKGEKRSSVSNCFYRTRRHKCSKQKRTARPDRRVKSNKVTYWHTCESTPERLPRSGRGLSCRCVRSREREDRQGWGRSTWSRSTTGPWRLWELATTDPSRCPSKCCRCCWC